jgi:flagellar protein FliS
MYALAPRGAEAYRQTQVVSRTPLELVVMLYEGLVRFLVAAEEAVYRRDIAARSAAMSRALAILFELQNTLNMERGGEIAVSLDNLYRYISLRLIDAAASNDAAPIAETIKILRTLQEGWQSIAAGEGRGGA